MKKSLSQIVTVIALLFNFGAAQAQAPPLGVAGTFVLFTTTGAVGNTGNSIITGNVGTNNGAITGFGNVNGTMHNANGTTAQAAADLLTAYNQLNSTIPTLFPGVLLGNGDTLEAGVYQSPALTTVSGNLYLDALGDSNAVFIFKVEAPLNTAANTKIILLNGAQACNVFWKTEGVVSLASGTFFRGTIIANNSAINLSPNDTLEGRALSTTGAVNVNSVNAYTPLGCGTPVLTGPAAPNLLSVQCYAIFSGNGSVTNAGITYVTGDVGTNVGLTVGYNPLLVNGTIHPVPDMSTAAAAADLITVYNTLSTLPHDIELLFPAQFGNDLVLTPHTYLLNAATAFNGTVVFDAQENSNAVFVIKVNGAFSTSTFSKMQLINGAQADNIFWSIDGALSIADFSVSSGTFVVNNAAIGLTTGDTVYGRVLTTNGALSTADNFVQSPSPCFPLPVSWLYFNGKPVQNDVLLEWGTANEINNDYFTIEKSKDGVTFATLTTVSAKSGNGNANQEYAFTDNQPYKLTYYRISQTDLDGNKEFYKTIQVNANERQQLNVFHYMKESNMYVQTSGAVPGPGSIELYSIDGKKISSQKIELANEVSTYKIETPLQKGMYLINIVSNDGILYTGKLAL